MTTLGKGGNTAVQVGAVRVVVGWQQGAGVPDVDCTALLLDPAGKVRGDNDMVFYNQPKHPSGAVVHDGKQQAGGWGYDAVSADLRAVEPGVDRIVVAASADGGSFGQVPGLHVTVYDTATGAEIARFTEMRATTETAFVVGELYRRQGAWKFRAVGQGWDTGLAGLATAFGISISEEAAAPATAPAPAPAQQPGVRFTKGEERLPAADRQRLNLRKQQVLVSLAKRGAAGIRARVIVVLDASGSMHRLYKSGIVSQAVERMAAVAAQLDDDGTMQVWAFADLARQLPDLTIAEMPGWLAAQTPKRPSGVGGSNNEASVIDQVRRWTAANPVPDPTLVLFFSDGGVHRNAEIERQLRAAASEPTFWQFIGLGRGNYGILERFDRMAGRVVDSVGFFAVDDISKVSDAELYDRLLGEFPTWIPEVRRLGILR
ncbi:VWA domain-containing protein [Dactylosporangium sp. NPDC049742]|uniref:VWA domain-containing protein n=1 Tax=Dactylosporangium sp. NPDC049742 TaxID=3154737 RepID=UPI00341977F1